MIKYVAEIGANHLGDPKLGFKLVKAAWKPWINGFFSKNHN